MGVFGKVSGLGIAAFTAVPAFAQEAVTTAVVTTPALDLKTFGAALALGIAVFGGAIGQSRAAAAALDGIARNPAASEKIFTPMIISLALIESLVLFAFILSYK